MDEAKLRFLFGTVPAGVDPDDPDERLRLLMEDRPDLPETVAHWALREAVVARLLDADPAGTWARIEERLAAGDERRQVFDEQVEQLVMTLEAAGHAWEDRVREAVVLEVPALVEAVRAQLGLDADDPATATVLEIVAEECLLDELAPVAPVVAEAPSVAHVPTLVAGAVLTHRVSEAEAQEEHLDLLPDLAPLRRLPDAVVAAGPLHVHDDGFRWGGPAGWLPAVPAGSVVALRPTAEGPVAVDAVAAPAVDPELVARLRALYDRVTGLTGLPVGGDELLLGLLMDERTTFARPQAPLTELATAAGLEQRDALFAHDEATWQAGAAADRRLRLLAVLDDDLADEAERALDLLDADPRSAAELRAALDLLDEADVVLAVAEELLHPDDGSRLSAVAALAERLTAAGGSAPRAASAHVLAAVVAERSGAVASAVSHLRAAAAVADAWAPVEERLGWYAFDRGNAPEAIGHWQAAGMTDDEPEMAVLGRMAALGATGAVPGRNDPCWCGSGRKFKQCHRDTPPLPPLAARTEWLQAKAAAYARRRGGAILDDIDALDRLVGGSPLDDPLDDPLVLDVLLAECGWFARFLAERGSLLPADEAELAASWLAVERGIYEVVGIAYGRGVRLRHLRDGAEVTVTGAEAARSASANLLVCARVAPDGGDGHVFLGEVVKVPRGLEDELQDLLDHGSPLDVADWLADAEPLD